MRRTKLVLAVAAMMIALLVAFAGPAMADNNGNNNNNNWNNNGWYNDGWDDFNRINNFDDDCEWEFEDEWVLTYWGWLPGLWVLDC